MNITNDLNLFREVMRHLWNIYLRPGADWDTAAMYRDICRMIFDETIVARNNLDVPPIPFDQAEDYLPCYKIIPAEIGRLPLSVNRDVPHSGYWDYPIKWIPTEPDHDIRPICFYDYDVLGWRKIEYYHVRIVNCCSHSELTGRDALIRCDYVDIEVIEEGQ